jgi:hypothetical protein
MANEKNIQFDTASTFATYTNAKPLDSMSFKYKYTLPRYDYYSTLHNTKISVPLDNMTSF